MAIDDVKVLPESVHRRRLARQPRKQRLCKDNRNYMSIPYTITPTVSVGDWGPMWRADRDYWIAKVTANCGKHDSTHPNDGCPIGASLQANMIRVKADLSNPAPILTSDTKIAIADGHHQDVANDSENGVLTAGDFALTQLFMGEHVFPRILQVGSTSPGGPLVLTLVLVPVR